MTPNPVSGAQALYDALPIPPSSACIRLLKVLAPADEQNAPIRCELFVADLDAKPEYCALSYVWGTVAPVSDYVICNGVASMVTTNCHSALRNLQTRLGGFTIWIDALCIHQHDDRDKEEQIRHMGTIYTSASTTYIWLGEGNATTEKVFDYFSYAGLLRYYYASQNQGKRDINPRPWVALFMHGTTRWSRKKSFYPYQATSSSWSRMERLRSDNGPSFHEIASVLTQPWINRIWTYQELVMAKNPVVLCGSSSIDWDRLAFSIVFLKSMWNCPQLQDWVELVCNRAIYQTQQRQQTVTPNELRRYWTFCASCRKVHRRFLFWQGMVWAMWVLIFVVLLAVTTYGPIDSRRFYRGVISNLSPLILVVLYARVTKRFAPNPAYMDFNSRPLVREYRDGWFANDEMHDRILSAISTRKATEAKDISFGLHSVLKQLSTPGLPIPKVNYALSQNEVYKELTVYLLMASETLRPVEVATDKPGQISPSWVPDYSLCVRPVVLLDHQPEEVVNHGLIASDPFWSFDKSDGNSLLVNGMKGFKVLDIFAFQNTSDEYESSEEEIHRNNLRTMVKWRRAYHESFAERSPWRFDRFIREIFSQDMSGSAPHISPDKLEAYTHFVSTCSSETLNTQFPRLIGQSRMKRSFQPEYSDPLALVEDWYSYISRQFVSQREILQTHITISNYLAHSKLLILQTSCGLTTSLGDARVGDEIISIHGLDAPTLMRESEGIYRIIGRVAQRGLQFKGPWEEIHIS